jgi:peptidoglycan hydrolase CwlO-like protein
LTKQQHFYKVTCPPLSLVDPGITGRFWKFALIGLTRAWEYVIMKKFAVLSIVTVLVLIFFTALPSTATAACSKRKLAKAEKNLQETVKSVRAEQKVIAKEKNDLETEETEIRGWLPKDEEKYSNWPEPKTDALPTVALLDGVNKKILRNKISAGKHRLEEITVEKEKIRERVAKLEEKIVKAIQKVDHLLDQQNDCYTAEISSLKEELTDLQSENDKLLGPAEEKAAEKSAPETTPPPQ